jgi:hypothetical protein
VSTTTLPHQETVAEVLKALETETTALFDYLRLEFLLELPVFAPDPRGRTRVFEPPELFRGLLHCSYENPAVETSHVLDIKCSDVMDSSVNPIFRTLS